MERAAIEPRDNWKEKAEAVSFTFHTMYGEPYWVDDAVYSFSLDEVETQLEDPSAELHAMCLSFVDEAVNSQEIMESLAIPESQMDYVARSWSEGDRAFYGRFDFAYDGTGPAKMLEYNADTPTGLFETAVFQWQWLEDQIAAGRLPEDTDQFNSVHEKMVGFWGSVLPGSILHFACVMESDEDRGCVSYIADTAKQAGHEVMILDVSEIGRDIAGRFTDTEDRVIDRMFKLYAWEDMLREDFAQYLRVSGCEFFEPAWKAVLSNKALLPWLWRRHRGHPNLLPAYFENDADKSDLTRDHVRKPFFSREGENVEVRFAFGSPVTMTGPYGEEGHVLQSYAPLFRSDAGGSATIGSWIVGGEAAGICVREDASIVTTNLSRFVPSIIR